MPWHLLVPVCRHIFALLDSGKWARFVFPMPSTVREDDRRYRHQYDAFQIRKPCELWTVCCRIPRPCIVMLAPVVRCNPGFKLKGRFRSRRRGMELGESKQV